jgi:TetR/AcrR family transcriptional regulator, repressor for uid operon
MDHPNRIASVPSERHARILDVAERCFVRAGFHRTTMQDVAAEAGMSPGNLYRYFPSKDAIAAGLAARDRARLAQDFSVLEQADDFRATFIKLVRKHFEEEPRERAVLCLEIWAEATRNPHFATITAEFDADVVERLTAVFERAKARGHVAASVDPRSAALLFSILADGLFVRRAVAPSFDAEREVSFLLRAFSDWGLWGQAASGSSVRIYRSRGSLASLRGRRRAAA